MPRARNDGVRLISRERLVDHLVGALRIELLTQDDVEGTLQQPLDELPAGINIHVDHDAGMALLHAGNGHWYEAGSRMSDCSHGRFPGYPRFQCKNPFVRQPEFGQSQPGMAEEDFAVAGGYHPPGVALEELDVESRLDLAEELGSGRLGESCGAGRLRETRVLVQVNEQSELTGVQV